MKTNNSSGGIGFLGALTLLFIALKLLGYIDWSWLWVLSPLWMPLLLAIAIALIILVVIVVQDRVLLRMFNSSFWVTKKRK